MPKKDSKGTFLNLIKSAVCRLSRTQRKFTWNRLATHLGISKSYLSQIIAGRKSFPASLIDSLVDSLELDDLGRHNLVSAFINDHLNGLRTSSKYCEMHLAQNTPTHSLPVTHLKEENFEMRHLFDHWYRTALLDLVETADFKVDFPWIGKRLGISPQLAEMTWSYFLASGHVQEISPGEWRKSNLRFRLADGEKLRMNEKQMVATRLRYYSQMMEKVKTQISDGSLSKKRRLIQGLTCSTNPKRFTAAKLDLERTLYSSAEKLSDGDCTEVYFLMTLAIPLTHSDF